MNDNTSAFNSSEYDNKIKQTLPYYEEFYRQVIDVVKNYFSESLSWLDVGCGTGKMAEMAFKEVEIDRFVLCDASQDMIKIAQNRFKFLNTEFFVSNIQNLNFFNEFDVVTSIMVNHYLQKSDRIAAVKRCYEALKSDGIFITFENFAPYSGSGKVLYLSRWKSYQLNQGKSINECEKHVGRYDKGYFPITISEHLEIMKDCGFKAVEILWLSYMQVGFLGIKQI